MTLDEAWKEGYQEGYRRALDATQSRTITTVEGLDALPSGTLVLTGRGLYWESIKQAGGVTRWREQGAPKDAWLVGSYDLTLPAVALREPEAEVGA